MYYARTSLSLCIAVSDVEIRPTNQTNDFYSPIGQQLEGLLARKRPDHRSCLITLLAPRFRKSFDIRPLCEEVCNDISSLISCGYTIILDSIKSAVKQ